MEEISQEEHKKLLSLIVIVAVLIIAAFFVYIYSGDIKLIDVTNNEKTFSEEEKLEILNSLSESADDTLSIEEKRAILEDVSKNKAADAYEYSEEGKLQILRTLQE